jgi:hypothetical protein
LTLAGLVVAVYYGIPMMRLAIWTARNDFREACKSELEAALPQTSACKQALDQPPHPPPIKKRGIAVVRGHNLGQGSTVLATCCISLVLLYIVVKKLTRFGRKPLEQNKTPIGLSIPAHILSKRGALIRILLDTAQHLEVEGDEWELSAELKAELITMIEQSGPHETTGSSSVQHNSVREHLGLGSPFLQDMQLPALVEGSSPDRVPLLENAGLLPAATGMSQPIKTRGSSPCRCTSKQSAEAAITVTEEKRDVTSVHDTAVNAFQTTRNRSQDVPVQPALLSAEAAPTLDSSTLLRPEGTCQSTLSDFKVACTTVLADMFQVAKLTSFVICVILPKLVDFMMKRLVVQFGLGGSMERFFSTMYPLYTILTVLYYGYCYLRGNYGIKLYVSV